MIAKPLYVSPIGVVNNKKIAQTSVKNIVTVIIAVRRSAKLYTQIRAKMAKYHLCPKYLAIYSYLQNIKQSSTVQQLIITITSSRFLNH